MIELGQFVAIMVVTLAIALGPLIAGVWLFGGQKRSARERRRSPLKTELLRGPGHSLRESLDDRRLSAMVEITKLLMVPTLTFAVLYAETLVKGRPTPMWILWLALAGIFAFTVYQIRAMLKLGEQLDRDRLGLDGEVAAGQELDQLMREGAAVFHDFPAEKFNIDHVVVSDRGVFAVETKGYSKPNDVEGRAARTISYDGQCLQGPGWTRMQPLEQARLNARWLGEWLTKTTGEPTAVTPVLALPGWYVQRNGRSDVAVFSGGELRTELLSWRGAARLNEPQKRRVEAAVEARCRDVKPMYVPEQPETD